MQSKIRPVVLVSRDSHLETRQLLMVVPVTTQTRGLNTQIPLGPEDGLPKACIADAGSISTIWKSQLRGRITELSSRKKYELNAALRYALGLD